MRFSARFVSAVLLAPLVFTVSLCAQTTTKPTAKTPRGTVSGRVTIKERGASGVAVGLRKSDGITPLEPWAKTTTDHDGFYRIPNVAPGSYEVSISAPAFVVHGVNPANKSKSVIVGEDENVEGINFTMVRGGVITGKVIDADGRPVIQQQVSLYRSDAFELPSQQQPQPPRQVFAVSSAQTDDRGIYRMFGLSAGRYKVAVGRSDDVFLGTFSPTRGNYRQVFHPDVTDQTKATVIDVSEGSEATGVDISLGRALQTFAVTGKVIDGENGLPKPNIRFGVQRHAGQRVEFVNAMALSNAQGDFILEGLVPGKYGFYLIANQNVDMRVEGATFDVTDQDVTGLTIRLMKGASLVGVVTLETEDKTALEKLSKMQIRAFVNVTGAGAGGFAQSAMSPIAPDGSFRLAGLPGGKANIMLTSAMGFMPIRGFNISRLERDGVVLPRVIDIKDGEQLTGVRVVVAFGSATLRGVVKLENGTLPEGARIFVRVNKVGEPTNSLPSPQVDARGHFLMEGVPSGNYELRVSIVGAQNISAQNRATREVSVQDGVVTEVAFTIDLAAILKP